MSKLQDKAFGWRTDPHQPDVEWCILRRNDCLQLHWRNALILSWTHYPVDNGKTHYFVTEERATLWAEMFHSALFQSPPTTVAPASPPGCVTERQAVERERKAFERGIQCRGYAERLDAVPAVDREYPLPAPKTRTVPRVVATPDGIKHRWIPGLGLQYDVNDGEGWSTYSNHRIGGMVLTDDTTRRVLAQLWASPTVETTEPEA